MSGQLNYTYAQSYLLTLKAIDSLTGSWSEGECFIEVIDINNNIPLFEKPFYDIVIPEDMPVCKYYKQSYFINKSLSQRLDVTFSIFVLNRFDFYPSFDSVIVMLNRPYSN